MPKGRATDKHRPQSAWPKARTVPREGLEREGHLATKERWQCIRRAQGLKPYGWNEVRVGAVADEASVGVHGHLDMHIDLICRTAGCVIRTSGGVGGRGREASSYPD